MFESKGKLVVNEDPIRLFNSDFRKFKQGDSFGLYGSVPLMHSIHSGDIKNKTQFVSSIFWNNAADTWVDFFSFY